MCGIAGIHRLSDEPLHRIDALASDLLRGINSRGGHATGYAWLKDDGEHRVQKASCDAFKFNTHRDMIPADVRTLILHTRFATQGDPAFAENNHPVVSGPIHAVHNGHVWNDRSIFAKLDKPRVGKVDSEAIPALVWARGWKASPDMLSEIEGDMAVAMFDVTRPGEFVLARGNSSPVVWHRTGDFLIFASTQEALIKAWGSSLGTPPKAKTLRYMREGSAIVVRDRTITHKDFNTGWSYSKTVKARVNTARPASPKDGWTWTKDETKKAVKAISQRAESILSPTTLDLIAEAEEEEQPRRVFEPFVIEGEDALRCDDCMEWYPVSELDTVLVGGSFNNLLCDTCKEWAQRHGMLTR